MSEVTVAETIVGAMMYMFCVAFSGGMGLLCAVGIGYKVHNKKSKRTVKTRDRGVV